MRILSFLAVGALVAPLAAQNALNETFSYSTTSTFPPTNWSLVNHNAGPNAWEEPTISTVGQSFNVLLSDSANHDDFNFGASNDNSIQTPNMNLASYSTPELTYDGELFYAAFTALGGAGNGTSDIECSTDGGVTWTSIWSETATLDYYTPGLVVDMSTCANSASVDMRFHYFGDYAHSWAIDNVVVDNGGAPTGPGLSISGTCPGVQSANASGMTAAGPVAFYYALAAGSTTIPTGGCAGLTLPVSAPTQLGGFVIADAAGNASLSGASQPSHCGLVILGAVDVAACAASNTVTL